MACKEGDALPVVAYMKLRREQRSRDVAAPAAELLTPTGSPQRLRVAWTGGTSAQAQARSLVAPESVSGTSLPYTGNADGTPRCWTSSLAFHSPLVQRSGRTPFQF